MSDIMLNAIIQMPYEMAMNDELSRRQFYERANQTLNERNAKAAQIERLREALRWTAGALQAACQSSYCSDEDDRVAIGAETRTVSQILDYADAALSGEPTC
ncbi:hypothetical protein [Alcaligenes sp. PF14]|uniref:hypothetical protein n=1 Tax=Alcaligenes sp. PF14 TaxID=3120297 RepID=UPI00301922BF